MVNNCCVVGCKNYVGKKPGLRFYRFPMSDKDRCGRWEAAVHRKDWHPKEHSRICGEHFVSGQPNTSSSHPDYVPSIFPDNYDKAHVPSCNHTERNNRLVRRLQRSANRDQVEIQTRQELVQQHEEHQELVNKNRKREREEKKQKLAFEKQQKRRMINEKKQAKEVEYVKQVQENKRLLEEAKAKKEREKLEDIRKKEALKIAEQEEKRRKKEEEERILEEKRENFKIRKEEVVSKLLETEKEYQELRKIKRQLDTEEHEFEREMLDGVTTIDIDTSESICYPPLVVHAGQQTDDTVVHYNQVLEENKFLKEKSHQLRFGMSMIAGDDTRSNFYTGLPWKIVVHLLEFLSPDVVVLSQSRCLEVEDEFFMVLVRLRLGLLVDDLAQRFNITNASVTRIFQKWLNVMHQRLHFLIKWPDQEVIRQNMPMAFKQLYPKCICIIDCSEIFIETPCSFNARSKTYSNYKKHNTVKFLIGITPCGSISFLSECWGGRVSDKVITQESKFLNNILQNDVILADRGFTIADDIGVHGGKLEIPSFTKGKSQLSQYDVEHSKQLSNVRIHVERVIGHLKKKFTILKGPIPINLLKHKHDVDSANIDRLLVVCAALCNLTKSVV